jgi:hypothetical protein
MGREGDCSVNGWQTVRQINYLLENRKWKDTGANEVVFGEVLITARAPIEAIRNLIMPIALIGVGSAEMDPEGQEMPDLVLQNFDVTIINSLSGDTLGENAMIGTNWPDANGTTSEGRGIMELEEELFDVIGNATTDSGIRIINKYRASDVVGIIDENYGTLVSREYRFSALVTHDRFYHPNRKFSASGGVGSASLSWTNAPDRYDYVRNIVRRASGSTAPTSITDGTGVTLASDKATSVTDSSLASGTYSYALFAVYDEHEGTSSDQSSAALTATVSVT